MEFQTGKLSIQYEPSRQLDLIDLLSPIIAAQGLLNGGALAVSVHSDIIATQKGSSIYNSVTMVIEFQGIDNDSDYYTEIPA